jgi:hypothetical protein
MHRQVTRHTFGAELLQLHGIGATLRFDAERSEETGKPSKADEKFHARFKRMCPGKMSLLSLVESNPYHLRFGLQEEDRSVTTEK